MSEAKPFEIPEEEFEEEYVRPSSGPGGQHQNKTENGVRLQWDIAKTAVLTDAQKERLRVLAAPYMQGDLLVVMERSGRSLAGTVNMPVSASANLLWHLVRNHANAVRRSRPKPRKNAV